MNTFQKHYKALRNGDIKHYDIVLCIKSYAKTKGKKNFFRQMKELFILSFYWKSFPYQYFMYFMYLNNCTLSIEEMKKYISNRKWFKMVDVKYRIICDDKNIASDLLSYYGFWQPEISLKYYKGLFFDGKSQILNDSEANLVIASLKHEKVFLKSSDESGGINIFSFKRKENGVYENADGVLSTEYIRKHCSDHHFMLQEGIVQDDLLSKLNPDSVNTIRILTKNEKGKVTIKSSSIRLGRKGKSVDNLRQGGVLVHVNIETGELDKVAKTYFDENLYYEHPDSHIVFDGIRLNRWDEVKSVAQKAAQHFYQMKYVGWDIVITKTGVCILEMNKRPDIYLIQLSDGGLADII